MKGPVVSFKKKDFVGKKFSIPHMGWNTLFRHQPDVALFKSIERDSAFYFVHTYFPEPKEENVVCTETLYGRKFCSSVARGHLFASQFHPEKSGTVGLRLLKNVIKGAALS